MSNKDAHFVLNALATGAVLFSGLWVLIKFTSFDIDDSCDYVDNVNNSLSISFNTGAKRKPKRRTVTRTYVQYDSDSDSDTDSDSDDETTHVITKTRYYKRRSWW